MQIRLLLVIVCSLGMIEIHAQNPVHKLVELYENQSYKEVISTADERANLSDKEAYYVGLAHYHLKEDAKAIQFFEHAIALDANQPEYHFYKGTCLMYIGAFPHAIDAFSRAILLKNTEPLYLVGKADALYNHAQLDSALTYYQQATDLPLCPSRAYFMQAQVLGDLKKSKASLEAYYLAKDKADPFTEEYIDVLYNIGIEEFKLSHFEKSKDAFQSIINLRPYDYQVISKLIQVHYAQEDFEKGNDLKQKLYKGYQKKELPGEQNQMFCFDQFKWKKYQIIAFERYFDSPNELYYKHIFYLMDDIGDVLMSVQTEASPAVAKMGKKYILGKNDKRGRVSYYDKLFEEDFDYNDLKKGVISIFGENKKYLRKRRLKGR